MSVNRRTVMPSSHDVYLYIYNRCTCESKCPSHTVATAATSYSLSHHKKKKNVWRDGDMVQFSS